MAVKFQVAAIAFFFATAVLVDFAAQARQCNPACGDNERCVSAGPRERRSHMNNTCVPLMCLTRARRGRCSGEIFHFDHTSMSCRKDHSGSCYGSNRFITREDCELSCIPWYRR